jgi:hypothetical protein
MGAHPTFAPRLHECLSRARASQDSRERLNLIGTIYEAIAPIDIAGFGDRKRQNRYPVLARDVLENSTKLGASRTDILELLKRCGVID